MPTSLEEVNARQSVLLGLLSAVAEHSADLKRVTMLVTPPGGEAVPVHILRAAAEIAANDASKTRTDTTRTGTAEPGAQSNAIPDEAGYAPTMPRTESATYAGIRLIYHASADGITLAAFKDALVRMGFLAGVADPMSSASSVITEMERKGWQVDRPTRGVYRFRSWPAGIPRPEPLPEGIV
jgi:hypothetical protein